MAINPFRLAQTLLEQLEKLKDSRVVGTATRAASGITSRLRTLPDYIPAELRRKKGAGGAQYLTPVELARVYARLPEHEKDAISEQIKTAASDALTTMEGLAPQGANLTHRAVGRLVFRTNGADHQPLPLHNMLIELWDRDFGADDILARGSTDRNGQFELWYDPADAGKWDRPDLELRIYEVNHIYKHEKLQLQQRLVYRIQGDDNVTKQTYDFGECPVPYWEYDPRRTTPRLLIVDNSTAPQSFSPSRSLVMVLELGEIQALKIAHRALRPSLQKVQDDYPENLTIQLEREQPGYTRSDEYFGERILNGMAASILDRDPRHPGRFWIHHHWNSYEQDGEHAAPNVDIFLELINGVLIPVEIKLQFRQPGDKSDHPQMQDPVTYTRDSEKWPQAKHVARVSAALHAELDVHLAQTHLNLEQYAIAAYRHLRKSPVRLVLTPHLKEVVLINREADQWLLGENGFITRSQALTATAIDKRLRQVLGTLDWKDWQPRKKICAQHTFADAAKLFWEALTEYVDKFFAENEERIRNHWYEIHGFSRDLVEHAVPFFLCGYLSGNRSQPDGRLPEWYNTNERMDLRNRPPEANGGKAVQPITESDEPQAGDVENLKQVCRYVIYHATFFHHWMNSKQLDDGGEIAYSGLGLRYGASGAMGPEEDESILPPADRASEQLWFASALSKTKFGFILTNEDLDIPPGLREALRAREKAFMALGVDLRQIPSRLNI